MGKQARRSKNRRLARQGPPPNVPRDLGHMYGRQGGIQMKPDEAFTFDMGEILWALGTGELTGEMAEVAAAAWLANVTAGRDDPLTLAREVAELGFDPGPAYAIAQAPLTAAELPAIAKELIDAGLLPPPPSRRAP